MKKWWKIETSNLAGHGLILQFSDPEEERYTVPEEAVHITQPEAAADPLNTLYNVTVEDTPSFGIKITRKDTGSVV